MKKTLISSLLVLLCISLVGCGKTSENNTTTKKGDVSTTTNVEPKQEKIDDKYKLNYESDKEFFVYGLGHRQNRCCE